MATREREEVSRILLLLATGEIQVAEALSRLNNWLVIKAENVGIDLTYAYEVTGSISDTDLTIIANAVEEAYKSAGYVATEPLVIE